MLEERSMFVSEERQGQEPAVKRGPLGTTWPLPFCSQSHCVPEAVGERMRRPRKPKAPPLWSMDMG